MHRSKQTQELCSTLHRCDIQSSLLLLPFFLLLLLQLLLTAAAASVEVVAVVVVVLMLVAGGNKLIVQFAFLSTWCHCANTDGRNNDILYLCLK